MTKNEQTVFLYFYSKYFIYHFGCVVNAITDLLPKHDVIAI